MMADDALDCPMCGTCNAPLGTLGCTIHYYCRSCGWEYSKYYDGEEEEETWKAMDEMMDEEMDDGLDCPQCAACNAPIGVLGSLIHYSCRMCGWDYSDKEKDDAE